MKEEDFKTKTEDYEVIKTGIVNLQVCSRIPPERVNELVEKVQKGFPAGTQNNWQLDENIEPVKCAEGKGWHYIFKC